MECGVVPWSSLLLPLETGLGWPRLLATGSRSDERSWRNRVSPNLLRLRAPVAQPSLSTFTKGLKTTKLASILVVRNTVSVADLMDHFEVLGSREAAPGGIRSAADPGFSLISCRYQVGFQERLRNSLSQRVIRKC